MAKGFLGLHQGARYRIANPDGSSEALTAKEYLARRGRYNEAHPLAAVASPGAGSRRLHNPGGSPYGRTAEDLARQPVSLDETPEEQEEEAASKE